MAETSEKIVCQKCNRSRLIKDFFMIRAKQVPYPVCKECLTLHVNAFEEDTYLWILEAIDTPYVPFWWNSIREKSYDKDPAKFKSATVLGKYISRTKLKASKDYGWADSQLLTNLEGEKLKSAAAKDPLSNLPSTEELKEKMLRGEISQSAYLTLTKVQDRTAEVPTGFMMESVGSQSPFVSVNDAIQEVNGTELEDELTDEDRKYLTMKWGKLYKPSEWIELERNYKEMEASFDIQDADTINTLILICKTNLKMNQYIDCGDVEGYQKLAKIYESLRKSAKFTAAQNKAEKADFVDSVGELVAMCEKQGFIPRYATDIPQDKIDFTLKDLKEYTYNLVVKDLGFGQQLEQALKRIEIEREIEKDEKLAQQGEKIEISDNDYINHFNQIQEDIESDLEVYIEEGDEE